MNKIILVGRLTRDPELRSTSMGISTANFTVAVNRNFKNKDGQYDADFISCVAFRNTADFVSKYFKKGNLISLDGRIQTRNYDAQDGTKRYVRVHTLIAKTFVPNPYNLPQVDHKDGNKLNCSVSNLEWVTNAENTQRGYDNGAYHFPNLNSYPVKLFS